MNSTPISSSANLCDDVWPPGFRFHPTDEELVLYYLKRKICRRKLKLDIIAEVDVYTREPDELPELASLKNRDRQWFFFSPRDRKYPNGSRANRATRQGYWKATGKDRTISCNSRNVGIKKTLVFYRGRAPTGQRTDWVMHEYVLEEDELKMCQNIHDYYVIYKLFKKSGSGPKNGEQYGAPFREEDWADDEFVKTTSKLDIVPGDHNVDEVPPADSCRNTQVDPSLVDVEELLNDIVDDQAPLPVNLDDFERALTQFLGEEETHSTVINGSIEDPEYFEPLMTNYPGFQQDNLDSSFIAGQSWDATEAASTARSAFTGYPELLDLQFPEEDFLEMDDLLRTRPVQFPPPSDRISGNAQLREDDGFDLFNDSELFLDDFTPNNQTVNAALHQRPQENGFVCQSPNYGPTSGNEMLNFGANNCIHNSTEEYRGTMPLPATGVAYADVSTSIASQPYQNQNSKQNEESQTWLSSTLWSFLEAMPASPASAAESVMVNKAFLRMSSFSRVRMNSKSTITSSAGRAPDIISARSVGGRVKGFFLLSFLAALLVVVCVFIGSHSSVFGKLRCRMDL
ncbi:unnamed protein product [Cuscuta epithymum]|uniref:NAC domain-containing protein n=1 Tax=Cuscuta epithymum TaxID=186058 RepID=A0AAV0DAK1_9ASTE|nr:unnamed protein product [Cuscuta epithymum]